MKRLLIYSQDGTGLGHLRRTRSIAYEVLAREPACSALILADSSVAPFFAPLQGVDYLKLPTVIKTGDSSWQTGTLPINVGDVLSLRAKIIRQAFSQFKPDAVLIDHMPVGALGELKPMLESIIGRASRPNLVLGLRDILDDPEVIRRVWTGLGAYEYLHYYDDILIYGCRSLYPVESAYYLSRFAHKLTYCHYVAPRPVAETPEAPDPDCPFIFVTVGGGKDGGDVLRAFLDAVPILSGAIRFRALILTGPNLSLAEQQALIARSAGYPVQVVASSEDATQWLRRASAVVTMAGYNSLCEVLAWRKKALVIPRPGPSAEQRIRSRIFAEHGLIRLLDPDHLTPERLAGELAQLLKDDTVPNLANIPPLDGAQQAATALLKRPAALIRGIQVTTRLVKSVSRKNREMKGALLRPIETTPDNGGLPIRLFLTPDLLPDAATMSQVEALANAPGLAHYVAVLPDIHLKGRNISPTGTVVVSKHAIVPRAIDIGINCGMRMLRSNIDARGLTAGLLDELFGTLMRTVPGHQHEQPVLTKEDVEEILVRGGAWSRKTFGLSEEELRCIEDGATTPTDTDDGDAILASIPTKVTKKGQRRFGTLGGGNHFLELQEIVEILEPDAAAPLGLSEGKAVFMLHTCGRGIASKLMGAYLPELEQKFFSGQAAIPDSPFWSVPADSEEGVKFTRAIAAVSNFGYANRIAITEQIRAAVRKVLHDSALALPLLYDCSHVNIKLEQWKGERLWIHRHGASRALPPSRLADHPIFSRTGQPLPIPGSMGADSFIAVAGELACETFYSVNHGAGRVMDKPEAVEQFSEAQVLREMRTKNIRLYRYGIDNIVEQAPGSFKNISQVNRAMAALALAKPVVRLRPVAVLKG